MPDDAAAAAAAEAAKTAEAAKAAEGAKAAADATKVAEATAAAEAARKASAKIELKLPDGSLLDAAAVEKVAAYAKERGLSQEQAQGVLDMKHLALSGYQAAQKAAFEKAAAEWPTQAKADKEIGGEGLAKNVEMSKRVINRYGNDAFKQFLNDSRLGDHPELIRVFSKIAKAMSEDQLVLAGTQGGAKPSMADRLYPTQNKAKE